jgi:hypothetical protein
MVIFWCHASLLGNVSGLDGMIPYIERPKMVGIVPNVNTIQLFFLLMALPGFFPGFLVIASVVHAIRES